MSKLNKLYAQVILQCCCDTTDNNEIYNLLLTKLLPSQLDRIKYFKTEEDNIQDNNEDELKSLYSDVDELQDNDPIVYIMLVNDLVDIPNKDNLYDNIKNSTYYPDELKCIALECFKNLNNNVIDECDGGCGGDAGGAIAAGR